MTKQRTAFPPAAASQCGGNIKKEKAEMEQGMKESHVRIKQQWNALLFSSLVRILRGVSSYLLDYLLTYIEVRRYTYEPHIYKHRRQREQYKGKSTINNQCLLLWW